MAKICASIAAASVDELKAQAEKAFALGADFIEARLDFLPPGQVMAGALAVDKGRAVFTLRPKDQGGKFAGAEEERIKLL
ncbi:MAG: type I 3-dehydroquinate dehydratase, partial [Nitrososphaera sp.]